jgi:hydroxymethylglutaryl-CoA reductase
VCACACAVSDRAHSQQDPAQNVASSNCMTLMEKQGDDLRISVTMPSIECASIGGGTHLPAQASSLALMGCKGANRDTPGANAQKFARAVATATLAGVSGVRNVCVCVRARVCVYASNSPRSQASFR